MLVSFLLLLLALFSIIFSHMSKSLLSSKCFSHREYRTKQLFIYKLNAIIVIVISFFALWQYVENSVHNLLAILCYVIFGTLGEHFLRLGNCNNS